MWEAPWMSVPTSAESSLLGLCRVQPDMSEDKIVRNTLFVVGGKEEKGRLRTILLVTATAATQEGQLLRSITLNSHGKNKWLWNGSIQKKTGQNNGTKVVGKEAACPQCRKYCFGCMPQRTKRGYNRHNSCICRIGKHGNDNAHWPTSHQGTAHTKRCQATEWQI